MIIDMKLGLYIGQRVAIKGGDEKEIYAVEGAIINTQDEGTFGIDDCESVHFILRPLFPGLNRTILELNENIEQDIKHCW